LPKPFEETKIYTFEYPLFFKLLFRFGNIFVTIILSAYLVPIIIRLDKDLANIVPLLIILALIYIFNRHYLMLYHILPYKIIADEEKIVCERFFLSKREVEFFYKDIATLTGGVFQGKVRGLMKVYDGKSKITIGFYDSIKDVRTLQTILLSRVNEDIYNSVIEKLGLKKKNK
jgi:hypothetical protein